MTTPCSDRTMIDFATYRMMVNNCDSNLINCRIDMADASFDMSSMENGEFEGGDTEGEGFPCLITDEFGCVVRFDGYYNRMDDCGNWSW